MGLEREAGWVQDTGNRDCSNTVGTMGLGRARKTREGGPSAHWVGREMEILGPPPDGGASQQSKACNSQ